jgi:NADH-quinone oxidoreductase subunit G
VPGNPDAGLIEVPAATNARGLRELGCLPNLGPGLVDSAAAGLSAPQIAETQLAALLLVQADPVRTHPDPDAWERCLDKAGSVIAFADFVTDSLAEHADVVFPAESYAEKDGTVTHPDGRLQRVRQAIGRPGEVRAQWSVLAELCARLGSELDLCSGPLVFGELAKAVPFYAGLTLEEIGGRGVRWQERDGASALEPVPLPDAPLETPPALPSDGRLRLGTAPSLWTGRETRHAAVLRFLQPQQQLELSPADAANLGVTSGDEVTVSVNGRSVRAIARVHDPVPPGSVFLVEGVEQENATALMNGLPRTVEVAKA